MNILATLFLSLAVVITAITNINQSDQIRQLEQKYESVHQQLDVINKGS